MRGYSKTLVTMCALILVLSLTGSAFAGQWQVTATNNSGLVRTDLHVVFTGTGGTIANAKITADGGTGAGAISVVGGNEIQIDWAPNVLPIGKSVTFEFTTGRDPIKIGSAKWTPGDVVIPGADIILVKKVPSLSYWGLIALLVLLIGATVFVVRRRRSSIEI